MGGGVALALVAEPQHVWGGGGLYVLHVDVCLLVSKRRRFDKNFVEVFLGKQEGASKLSERFSWSNDR